MRKLGDVTEEVEFGWNDDEYLPIIKCVCGEKFDLYDEMVSVYYSDPWTCPNCGTQLIWEQKITVYEVMD